jgi:hypothetical protein
VISWHCCCFFLGGGDLVHQGTKSKNPEIPGVIHHHQIGKNCLKWIYVENFQKQFGKVHKEDMGGWYEKGLNGALTEEGGMLKVFNTCSYMHRVLYLWHLIPTCIGHLTALRVANCGGHTFFFFCTGAS